MGAHGMLSAGRSISMQGTNACLFALWMFAMLNSAPVAGSPVVQRQLGGATSVMDEALARSQQMLAAVDNTDGIVSEQMAETYMAKKRAEAKVAAAAAAKSAAAGGAAAPKHEEKVTVQTLT